MLDSSNYLSIVSKDLCTGCMACSSICPVSAISMQEDKEGFLFPAVDKEKCTNCGLCKSVCPILKSKFHDKPATCFAVMASDEIRMKSSSGGMFTVIAEHILAQGGYVCGAAFDENWNVKHIIVDNVKNLDKLRGSKYVQSYIGNIYKDIKALLENGKTVLFTGTPCQVAGLTNFLDREYTNLLTIDVVCHGVPNNSFWQQYLRENFSVDTVNKINFRDKELGWNAQYLTATTSFDKIVRQDFMDLYAQNICLRSICSSCNFAKPERVSDITMGDFWGIEVFKPELYDPKGISILLVNSDKGHLYLNAISDKFKYLEEFPIDMAKYNGPLFKAFEANTYRSLFFENLDKAGFNYAYRNTNFSIAILNFWWCNNYGAICTAFALQEVIKNLGYAVKTINWIPQWFYDANYKGGISEKFAAKHFNLTELCHSKTELKQLNNSVSKFVVGSDQVWRYGVEQLRNWQEFNDYDNICFLSFADFDKPKLAYAASFATTNYEGTTLNKQLVSYLLSRFQAISVREDTGVDLCKNEFNVPAVQTLDPVFLLDKSYWENIISESELIEKNYICYYILDNIYEKSDLLDYLEQKYDKKCIDISKNFQMSIEDWLYYIKNCDLFIADSFHGCCFAIIFNKPFICVKNPLRGKDRFESLFRLLGLENSFLNFGEDIAERLESFFNVDWVKVNQELYINKQKSLNWLKNNLEAEFDLSLNKQMALNEGLLSLIGILTEQLKNKTDNVRLYTEINNLIRLYDSRISELHAKTDKLEKVIADGLNNIIRLYDGRLSKLQQDILNLKGKK